MTNNEDFPEDDFYASGNVRDDEEYSDMRGHNGGPPYDDGGEAPELDGLTTEDQLKLARQILLEDLITSVAKGHASPQEKNTLRQMLKDNGMVMGDPFEGPEGDTSGGKPKADLPSFQPPEYVSE